MAQIFLNQQAGYYPAIFTTPGKYSMDTAVELLKKLERDGRYQIENEDWKTEGYGNLIEVGIKIYFENAVFSIMCSYEDIFISRISGNRKKYYEFCEPIRLMELNDA